MFPLIFAILFTGLSVALILPNLGELQPWERGVALLFPLAGLFAIRAAWVRRRRRRSLRVEEDGWYTWIEIDGTPRRSTRDPREDWDAADGDGDGGDGGGD